MQLCTLLAFYEFCTILVLDKSRRDKSVLFVVEGKSKVLAVLLIVVRVLSGACER